MAMGLLAVVVTTGLAVVAATQVVTARARAVTAADAAALAAAAHTFPPLAGGVAPLQAARLVAKANGARLERCICPVVAAPQPRSVEVAVTTQVQIALLGTVEVGAASRAEYVP